MGYASACSLLNPFFSSEDPDAEMKPVFYYICRNPRPPSSDGSRRRHFKAQESSKHVELCVELQLQTETRSRFVVANLLRILPAVQNYCTLSGCAAALTLQTGANGCVRTYRYVCIAMLVIVISKNRRLALPSSLLM